MNIPNVLTLFRIAVLPFIVVLYYLNPDPSTLTTVGWVIAILFVIASFTDFLDGYIARKYQLVTNFGKFADPLADKLLVLVALLMFLDMGIIPMWTVMVILTREFIVTGMRLVAVEQGLVIAASWWGKAKTFVTLFGLIFLFFYFTTLGLAVYYVGVILTVISGVEYLVANRQVFKA